MLKSVLNQKTWNLAAIAYAYSAVILFFATWTRPLLAVLLIGFIGINLWKFFTGKTACLPEADDKQLSLAVVLAVIVLALVVGYYCGWSGGTPQSGDWDKHNAVFRDLVEIKWPVYYTAHKPAMLTYYIGQYLLPAALGKAVHSFAFAYGCFYLWNVLGLVLVITGILLFCNFDKLWKQLAAAVGFMFLNTGLPLAQLFTAVLRNKDMDRYISTHWFSVHDINLQYRSIFVDLRWVFPQCLVAWLLVLVFVQYTHRVDKYVFMLMPAILYGTWSFLALVLLALLQCVVEGFKRRKGFLPRLFSVSNFSMALPCLTIVCYLSGNVLSDKPESLGMYVIDFSGNAMIYIVFCLFSFALYTLLLKKYWKEPLFAPSVVLLCFIPFVHAGTYNDFCMCTSIVPMFVVYIYLLKYLVKAEFLQESCEAVKYGVLLTLVLVGALYPASEWNDVLQHDELGVQQMNDTSKSLEQYTDYFTGDEAYELEPLIYNYYTYDPQNDFFSKYLAQAQIGD